MSKKHSKCKSKSLTPGSSTSLADQEFNPRSGYAITRDATIGFFTIVKEASEASEILSPLKATCGIIIYMLETTRVRGRASELEITLMVYYRR
jgi:hypothetical protein